MAARRISQSSVNWAAILERIPETYKPRYVAFKAHADANLRNMLALPEKSPSIDWSFYKSKVANPALVDSFQKKYEALQIPFPPDYQTAQLNAQEKEMELVAAEDIKASNERIAEYEAKLAHISSQLPLTEMTYEEFAIAFPDQALDPINKPTAWPHDPEEIREYEEAQAKKAKGEKAH